MTEIIVKIVIILRANQHRDMYMHQPIMITCAVGYLNTIVT